jgi:hypothetical protein
LTVLQFAHADDARDQPSAAQVEPLLSPSLYTPTEKEAPAYELKFLLTEAMAQVVESRARETMSLDPHAGPSGIYRTTSLYCDTPRFDVFHRIGKGRRRKHRLRRYGAGTQIFLERKTKRGQRVRKRRCAIPETELSLLANPLSLVTWAGHWFHRQLLNRELRPACRISYDRTAFMSPGSDGPVRLTLDRNLRGGLASAWSLEPVEIGDILLPGEVICEFKYRSTLPPLFKQLVEELKLTPGSVSKYRHYLRSTGLTEPQET